MHSWGLESGAVPEGSQGACRASVEGRKNQKAVGLGLSHCPVSTGQQLPVVVMTFHNLRAPLQAKNLQQPVAN